MACAQGIVKGVPGVGLNVDESVQEGLISSQGMRLPYSGLWHLELSPTKHAFLSRGEELTLYVKDFGAQGDRLVTARDYVQLDLEQVVDLMFTLDDLLYTVRRNQMREVSSFFFLFSFFL